MRELDLIRLYYYSASAMIMNFAGIAKDLAIIPHQAMRRLLIANF
jgi:hypothetical protein